MSYAVKIFDKDAVHTESSPLNGEVQLVAGVLQSVVQSDGGETTLVKRVKDVLEAAYGASNVKDLNGRPDYLWLWNASEGSWCYKCAMGGLFEVVFTGRTVVVDVETTMHVAS
jgi:hypothetical protein